LNANPAAGLKRGDLDRDFDVDITDLGNMATNLNQPAPVGGWGWGAGDTDDDGDVDITDLGNLATNLNQAPGIPPVTSVPEPAAASMGLIAVAALARRRRR
jgi:MYXO-CTERM domain-containing protein